MNSRALALVLLLATAPLLGCIEDAPAPADDASPRPPLESSAASTPTPSAPAPAPTPEAPPAVADIVVESVRAEPDEPFAGETVTLVVVLVNAGGAAGAVEVAGLWDGEPQEEAREVSVPAGARREAAFELVTDSPGQHEATARVGSALHAQPVWVREPRLQLDAWTFENPGCRDHLDVSATLSNPAGVAVEGWVLEVYSTNAKGRTMGHATFAVPEVGPGATVAVGGPVFAPADCSKATATYTLTFILTWGGVEKHRETTEPFRPVTA